MPVPEATHQVERLREVAGFDSGVAVQIVPAPSYLRTILYDDAQNEPDLTEAIVLVYKANTKTSTSSLPIDVRDELNVSVDSDIVLGGDPLPAPFSDCDEFEVSVSEKKQYQWPKGELNHFPLQLQDALKILNDDGVFVCEPSNALNVWCLLDGGIIKGSELQSPTAPKNFLDESLTNNFSVLEGDISCTSVETKLNRRARILMGVHKTEGCWTRSFVESQGMCSIASPEMDPLIMKKSHLDIAKMPDYRMNAVVLCRYNISGRQGTPETSFDDRGVSVSVELKWRQPTVSVPLQEATARLLIQATVGSKSSPAYHLWKQLSVLHELFGLLLTGWREKTTPNTLPHLDSESTENLDSRLRTLILGGQQALQTHNSNRRMSLAPALLGRASVAPLEKGRPSIAPGLFGRMSMAPQAMMDGKENEMKAVSLADALELANTGMRGNSDITDGLFSLLIECKTYRQLREAWDFIFMELNDGRRPFIRPKNSTRASKLIQGYVSGQVENNLEFIEMEGSLYLLELLIEMGLEKLTTDYYYIFLESQLVSRDELQAPELVRAGLGVPKDKWFASCGELLGWLAQVHTALEIVLPLQEAMQSSSFPFMASKPLKYYQSEKSPIRSVAGLLSPSNSVQEFSFNVKSDYIRDHINHSKSFDYWRMTLTSEDEMMRVRSVFLRSHLHPIFPPQLNENADSLVPVEGVENNRFYCAQAVSISQKFI